MAMMHSKLSGVLVGSNACAEFVSGGDFHTIEIPENDFGRAGR